jgi:L-malate glycosyltransferase
MRMGLETKVLVYFENDLTMLNQFKASGIEVECLNWNRRISSLNFVLQLRKVFMEHKPTLVHVQYMAPGALPILAAKLAGVSRIFATVHQPWTPSLGRIAKRILRSAARLCERFTVVSQNAERSWFGTAQRVDANKPIAEQPRHLTLYNAVDVARLMEIQSDFATKPSLKEFGIPFGAQIVGTVARLRHEKGIDILIQAFARLASTDLMPRYLVIVGDGPDRNKLVQLAGKLGIASRVIFIGSTPWEEAMQWMSQMDIVVVPSRLEGFGLTAAEAMAMGKPVVVSNTHGLSELVDHNVNGLVFDVDDVAQLSDHLSELLTNSDWAHILKERAQTTIWARFDLPIYERNVAALCGLTLS